MIVVERAEKDEGQDDEHDEEGGARGESEGDGVVEDDDGRYDGGEEDLRGEDAVNLADEGPAKGVLAARDARVQHRRTLQVISETPVLAIAPHAACLPAAAAAPEC